MSTGALITARRDSVAPVLMKKCLNGTRRGLCHLGLYKFEFDFEFGATPLRALDCGYVGAHT
jgi:hypothetical protein